MRKIELGKEERNERRLAQFVKARHVIGIRCRSSSIRQRLLLRYMTVVERNRDQESLRLVCNWKPTSRTKRRRRRRKVELIRYSASNGQFTTISESP